MMINQQRGPGRQSGIGAAVHALFAIDPRTLSLFRIAIAGMLLVTLVTRAKDVRDLYSEQGALPADSVRVCYQTFDYRGAWSVHWLDDRVEFQAGLLLLAGVLGIALLVGFQTRWATASSWFLLASFHTRVAGLVVNGGDVLLLLMLFWGMFLPLDHCWSIDAWRRGGRVSKHPVLSIGTAAVLVQVFLMYLITGLSKCNEVWFSGQALARALSIEQFSNSWGRSLTEFPWVLRVATYGAFGLELIGPFLLFSPWLTRCLRSLAVLGFTALHVGIALTMNVDLFPFHSLAALTLFVPAAWWRSRGPGSCQADGTGTARAARSSPSSSSNHDTPPRGMAGRIADGLCLACLVFAVVYNVLAFGSWPDRALPRSVDHLARLLAFGQRWDMFSHGGGADFRILGVAQLRDGSEVDILRGGAPVREQLEQLLPAPGRLRWTQLFTELKRPTGSWFRQSVARYCCREWNAGQPPERQIVAIEFVLLEEDLSSGADPGAVKSSVLVQLDLIGTGPYAFDRKTNLWRRHGEWTLRYPSGQEKARGAFHWGRENGHWVHWLEDGSKHGEGSYDNGEMTGEWLIWENGVVTRELYR